MIPYVKQENNVPQSSHNRLNNTVQKSYISSKERTQSSISQNAMQSYSINKNNSQIASRDMHRIRVKSEYSARRTAHPVNNQTLNSANCHNVAQASHNNEHNGNNEKDEKEKLPSAIPRVKREISHSAHRNSGIETRNEPNLPILTTDVIMGLEAYELEEELKKRGLDHCIRKTTGKRPKLIAGPMRAALQRHCYDIDAKDRFKPLEEAYCVALSQRQINMQLAIKDLIEYGLTATDRRPLNEDWCKRMKNLIKQSIKENRVDCVKMLCNLKANHQSSFWRRLDLMDEAIVNFEKAARRAITTNRPQILIYLMNEATAFKQNLEWRRAKLAILTEAAIRGNMHCVKIVFQCGVNPSEQIIFSQRLKYEEESTSNNIEYSDWKGNVLFHAINNRQSDVALFLLEKATDPKLGYLAAIRSKVVNGEQKTEKCTAWALSLKLGNTEVIRAILKKELDTRGPQYVQKLADFGLQLYSENILIEENKSIELVRLLFRRKGSVKNLDTFLLYYNHILLQSHYTLLHTILHHLNKEKVSSTDGTEVTTLYNLEKELWDKIESERDSRKKQNYLFMKSMIQLWICQREEDEKRVAALSTRREQKNKKKMTELEGKMLEDFKKEKENIKERHEKDKEALKEKITMYKQFKDAHKRNLIKAKEKQTQLQNDFRVEKAKFVKNKNKIQELEEKNKDLEDELLGAVEELADLQRTLKIARNQNMDTNQKDQLNTLELANVKLSKKNKNLKLNLQKEKQKKTALENTKIDHMNKIKELQEQIQQIQNNNKVVQTEARIEMKESARRKEQMRHRYEEKQRDNRKRFENRMKFMEMENEHLKGNIKVLQEQLTADLPPLENVETNNKLQKKDAKTTVKQEIIQGKKGNMQRRVQTLAEAVATIHQLLSVPKIPSERGYDYTIQILSPTASKLKEAVKCHWNDFLQTNHPVVRIVTYVKDMPKNVTPERLQKTLDRWIKSEEKGQMCPLDKSHMIEVKNIPNTDQRKTLRGQKGVFATKRIKAGTVLAPYRSMILSDKEYAGSWGPLEEMQYEMYHIEITTKVTDWFHAEQTLAASAFHHGNWTKYANDIRIEDPFNSYDLEKPQNKPNVALIEVTYKAWPYTFLVSLKSIRKGQELLLNYGDDYWEAMRNIKERHDTFKSIVVRLEESLKDCHGFSKKRPVVL